MKNNLWMDLIGRASFLSLVVVNLIFSFLFSYPVLFAISLLDRMTNFIFIEMNMPDNQFTQHLFSYAINFIICFIFGETLFHTYHKYRSAKKTKINLQKLKIELNHVNETGEFLKIDSTIANEKLFLNLSIICFALSVFASCVNFYITTSWLAIQLFIGCVMCLLMIEIVKKFYKFSDAIDRKIDFATIRQINQNLIKNGFTTFVFDVTANSNKQFLISCSEDAYDAFHQLLSMYTTNYPSQKFLLHFLKDKQILIDENYNFIDVNKVVLSEKDFLKMYYEYVTDYKRINSKKANQDFLGI